MRYIVGVAALALLAAGCGFFGGEEITAGTCLERTATEDGAELSVIDCDRPHDMEIVGVVDASDLGSSWPGDTELSRWAFQACATAFEDYVGQPYGTSVLDLDIEGPGEEQWRAGDREVLCGASHLDGQQRRGSITD